MKQVRAAALIGITAALLSGAGGRRKLWDLDLSKFTNHQADTAALVWGVRFSPDETKVAIGFGPRWNFDPRPRHVVVVAADQPQTALREFELNTRAYSLPSEDSILWSPSGTTLVTIRSFPPAMLRLDGRSPCVFPDGSGFGGFLSGDRMVIFLRFEAEIRIVGPDCSLIDQWMINGPADVLDTSPEQDVLAIQTYKPPEHVVIDLVASRTHEIKQRWVWENLPGYTVASSFPIRAG
jgi:hypothetical protein